jgi:hypothetical protein
MNWKRLTLIIAALALIAVGGGMAISATYTDFTSGDIKLSKSGIEPTANWMPFVDYRKFDLGDANINAGSGVTHGDVVRLFNVEENTYIEEFGFRCTTAAVKSGTSAEVGDGADIDGYVGNTYSKYTVAPTYHIPGIDFDAAGTGVSRWAYIGELTAGAGFINMSGISFYYTGLTGTTAWGAASNHGAYFTSQSGISPYIGKDTIDMTFYVDKSFAPGAGKAGVTPVFEAYIKGFKRVVP